MLFVGGTGKTYVGTITKVGWKMVHMNYRFRHGGESRATRPIHEVVYL